jgi:hypothetical protein
MRNAALSWLLLLGGVAQAQDAEPWFVEVGQERGLAPGNSHRNKLCDVDGDGWVDAVVGNQRLYRNVHDPAGGRRFEEVEGALGLTAGVGRPPLLLLAALDDDGDLDAYLAFNQDPTNPKWTDPGFRPQIRLQERGGFRDAGTAAVAKAENQVSAAFFDYDRDGRLDLVTSSNYKATGGPLEAYPPRLYRGQNRGAFREVTDSAGLGLRPEPGQLDSRRPFYGVATGDWNGDGWEDLLLLGYGRQRNMLFQNLGDMTFTDVGVTTGFAGDDDQSGVYPEATKQWWRQRFNEERQDEAPFRSNGNTFDAACADYDNDGDLDIFLGEITHAWAGPSSDRSALLTNMGDRFRRDADAAPRQHRVPNWNQGDLYCGWLDIDNDGLLDLVIASGDYPDEQLLRLFHQGPPGRFQDVTPRLGIRWENCAQPSFADYDRDGDVDILIGTTTFRMSAERKAKHVVRPALFENRIGQRNHWLNVRLEGKGAEQDGANRSGLGARIVVEAGDLRLTRDLSGGRGHAGHTDAYEAAFGLGSRTTIDRLTVYWPNRQRTVSTFTDLPADRFLLVREAGPELVVRGPF